MLTWLPFTNWGYNNISDIFILEDKNMITDYQTGSCGKETLEPKEEGERERKKSAEEQEETKEQRAQEGPATLQQTMTQVNTVATQFE